MTIAVASPIRMDAARPLAVVHRVILARMAPRSRDGAAPGLLVLERPRLVPPALEGEVGRRVDPELAGGAPDARAERVEVEVEDVAQPLDPRPGS